jgi:hypothetical protein
VGLRLGLVSLGLSSKISNHMLKTNYATDVVG